MDRRGLVAWALLGACLVSGPAGAQAPEPEPAVISERDYLAEVPIVLSVSRLAQRLDETPGAVTILDRDLIRRSGARDLVELLRLVPGFQTTTSFETDAPVATYHGRADDWANRIQVLVDGRSVYSTQLQGSAGVGLQTLSLDEIDRVEVLRGSNSAAYGARAFLGVVNIISRDVRESQGFSAYTTQGDNRVKDSGLSLGWGANTAMFRLHADTRSDAGLRGAFGASQVERLNLSGRLAVAPDSEVEVRAGLLDIHAGRGSLSPDEYGNAARIRHMGSAFAQLDWRHVFDERSDVLVSLSHTEHTVRDRFPYLDPGAGLYYGIDISFSGDEYNDALAVQWNRLLTPDLKTASGFELRSERLVSPSAFGDRNQVITSFARLFGSAEWRLSPDWVVNASGLFESSTPQTEVFSPRLMVNWHAAPGHTLRAGVSTAFRPPSAYERYSVVEYRDINGANPLTYVRSTNQLVPERILVREVGYHMTLAPWPLTTDFRGYEETVTDGVRIQGSPTYGIPNDHLNGDSYRISGMEWQFNWQASSTSQWMLTQSWASVQVLNAVDPDMRFRMEHSVARYAATLAWLHRLDNGLDIGLTYSRAEDISLLSISTRPWLFNLDRVDLRLAKAFQVGKNRAEVALTLQNLGGPNRDGDWQFRMDPRALLTLRIDQ